MVGLVGRSTNLCVLGRDMRTWAGTRSGTGFIEQPSFYGEPRWNSNVLTRKNDFGKPVNSETLGLIRLYLEWRSQMRRSKRLDGAVAYYLLLLASRNHHSCPIAAKSFRTMTSRYAHDDTTTPWKMAQHPVFLRSPLYLRPCPCIAHLFTDTALHTINPHRLTETS
jgi:hypothetical protein